MNLEPADRSCEPRQNRSHSSNNIDRIFGACRLLLFVKFQVEMEQWHHLQRTFQEPSVRDKTRIFQQVNVFCLIFYMSLLMTLTSSRQSLIHESINQGGCTRSKEMLFIPGFSMATVIRFTNLVLSRRISSPHADIDPPDKK